MTSDVIGIGEYRKRRQPRRSGCFSGRYSDPCGRMPTAIVRIYWLLLDAPKDPPLVQLAWLLSYFWEVPLPDGNTYRLGCGRLEERAGESWARSTAMLDDLARLTHGLAQLQWLQIASASAPRQVVYSLDQLSTSWALDGPETR